jgi:hypothetical protein
MVLRRALTELMALLTLAALAQLLFWGPQLPDRVASHFDLNDHVNGWMDRTPFLVITALLPVLMAGLFLGLSLLIARIPDALINLPHKDYWLAPSRRAESLAHTASCLLAIGCATQLLLLVIFEATFELNADLESHAASAGGAAGTVPQLVLPLPFLAVMGLYLATVATLIAWMLWRFRKPAAPGAAPNDQRAALGAKRT